MAGRKQKKPLNCGIAAALTIIQNLDLLGGNEILFLVGCLVVGEPNNDAIDGGIERL